MYHPNKEMKHVLFTEPYLWEDKLRGFTAGGEAVRFVLAVPIAQNELEYKAKFGLDALETLLEERETDIFDLGRKSVV